MKTIKCIVAAVFSLSAVLALVGCNTMHGLGQDISSGGKALERASSSKKAKKDTATTDKMTVTKAQDQ